MIDQDDLNDRDDGQSIEAIAARLIRQIASGGKPAIQALTELFRFYRKKLIGYLVITGSSLDEAEDIVQQVFIKVSRKAHQWQGHGSAVAWLRTMARNTRIDRIRSARPELDLDDAGWERIEGHDEESDPDVDALSVEDCVGKALNRFSAKHPGRAEAIRLLHLEKWSIEHLAQHIKRTHAATKQFLYECRKAFKPYVDPCQELLQP